MQEPSVGITGGTPPGGGAVPNPLGTTSLDGGHVTLGAKTDAEAAAGDGSVIALLKRHRTLLASIVVLLGAGLPAALVAGRMDVSLGAFNASLPAGTNRIGATADSVFSWLGSSAPTVGQKAMASSLPVTIASDQSRVTVKVDTSAFSPSYTSGNFSIGTSTGKANVLKTGSLTTTAATADQVVLTYTVTGGKTLYLEYFCLQARLTAVSATASILGAASLETPSGTKVFTATFINPTHSDVDGPFCVPIGEPVPIAAAAVIRVVTTPTAVTSMLWIANFGGYEK